MYLLSLADGLKCDGEEVRDEDGLARPPVPPVPPPRSPIVDAKPAERSPPELPPCNTTASIDTILAVGGALDTSVVPLSPSSAIDGRSVALHDFLLSPQSLSSVYLVDCIAGQPCR